MLLGSWKHLEIKEDTPEQDHRGGWSSCIGLYRYLGGGVSSLYTHVQIVKNKSCGILLLPQFCLPP